MKELQNKVIRLGVERGYLPKNAGDNSLEKFDIQYLRFIEEIGEVSRELRLGNYDAFKMEVGDALVLHTNCKYILDEYLDMFTGSRNSLNLSFCTLEKLIKMQVSKSENTEFKKECLQLAYDKIVSRGGMLIDGDWFKPTDKEYQQAKLYQLKERLIDALTINPKYEVYRDKLKEIYSELHYLNYINLDEDDVKLIIALEAEIEMSIGELNKKEI